MSLAFGMVENTIKRTLGLVSKGAAVRDLILLIEYFEYESSIRVEFLEIEDLEH